VRSTNRSSKIGGVSWASEALHQRIGVLQSASDLEPKTGCPCKFSLF
jgi:hypothetical protein